MRSILSLLAVAALSLSVAPQSAEAGLFGCFKQKSSCCDLCCQPEPSCCAPVQTCCAPAPVCCTPAPVCCEPAPCCDPCGKPRCKLFSGLFKKCFSRHNNCCPVPEPCCAPAPVSCCAPAAPSCAAPAPCCGM